MENPPWIRTETGLLLAIRLTPRAHRNGVDGVMAGADGRPVLQLRLAAPPVEGAANAALLAFLGAALGLRGREMALVAGERSRLKRVALTGDPAVLEARLLAWLAAAA